MDFYLLVEFLSSHQCIFLLISPFCKKKKFFGDMFLFKLSTWTCGLLADDTLAIIFLWKWIYVKIKKYACQYIILLIIPFLQKKVLFMGVSKLNTWSSNMVLAPVVC
jgi:hypothetical protein